MVSLGSILLETHCYNTHILGFFNVILFATTYQRVPKTYLPSFSAPRKSLHITNFGITPFIIPGDQQNQVATTDPFSQTGQHEQDLEKMSVEHDRSSVATLESFQSADSNVPLTSH